MNLLQKYDIDIQNKELLLTALCHSSYANEKRMPSYERLEFLGDAVLQLIVSDYLYKNYHDLKEGQMSKIRASYVCEEALNVYEKDIGYKKYIRVSNGLHNRANSAITADVFEAILAVIYLEKGYETAKNFIHSVIIPHIEKNEHFFLDYKSAFQEYIQTSKRSVIYEIENISEDISNPLFRASAKVDNLTLGVGMGKTKKEAEQMAAKDALKKSAR